jgi:hypothetical protein
VLSLSTHSVSLEFSGERERKRALFVLRLSYSSVNMPGKWRLHRRSLEFVAQTDAERTLHCLLMYREGLFVTECSLSGLKFIISSVCSLFQGDAIKRFTAASNAGPVALQETQIEPQKSYENSSHKTKNRFMTLHRGLIMMRVTFVRSIFRYCVRVLTNGIRRFG